MKMKVSPTYLIGRFKMSSNPCIGETLLFIQNVFEIPELTEDVFMTTSKVDRGIGILPELIVFLFLSTDDRYCLLTHVCR